jgi:hypothetical protein
MTVICVLMRKAMSSLQVRCEREGERMAANQKSIFIRFNMDDKADKELYLKLTEKAGGSSSLTAYVKKTLEEYLNVKTEMSERQQFHEQMLLMVREEMQLQGMKLVGALLAGIGTVNVQKIPEKPVMEEAGLPEACGRLPEDLKGVLDLIG